MSKKLFPILIGILVFTISMGCSKKESPETENVSNNQSFVSTPSQSQDEPTAEEHEEYDEYIDVNIKDQLSSYLINFMGRRSLSSIAHRTQLAQMFIDVFNLRRDQGGYPRDTETLERFDRFKEAINVSLDMALSDAEWYSDAQDARNGTIKIMVCYMILAMLEPDNSSLQNKYIDTAKAIALKSTGYDDPVRYTAVVFLEILLKNERKQKNIETLNKLYLYLSDITESQNYEDAYSVKEDMEFISAIINNKTGGVEISKDTVSSDSKSPDGSFDFSKILKGDFSELAGTWVNKDGIAIELLADGTFAEGQSSRGYAHMKDSFGISEYYQWSTTDPVAPIYHVLLLPAGVDYTIGSYTSDKTKVRLVRAVQDASPSTVYYPEQSR